MSSILNKLAKSGQLSSAELNRVEASARRFSKLAESNPVLLRNYLSKLAAKPWPLWKQVGASVLATTAAAGAAALGNVGVRKITEIWEDTKRAKRYKEMLDANPELTAQGVNSKMVQLHFKTLHKFNPDYAADPLVAGAYVQNQLEATRPNIEALNNIVKARKERAESLQTKDVMGPVIGPASPLMTGPVKDYLTLMSTPKPKAPPMDPLGALKGLTELGKLERQIVRNPPSTLTPENLALLLTKAQKQVIP